MEMLFNSIEFALFLPCIFILYWKMSHNKRWFLLLVVSYIFYMSWNIECVILIFINTVISFFCAIQLKKANSKKVKLAFLWLAVVFCIGTLFVFKYFNFIYNIFCAALNQIQLSTQPLVLNLILPVGISFYTFQTLSYVIDVYREKVEPEKHLGIYATFISFFPQLVAGPIERTENLLPQIEKEKTFNYEETVYGLKLMAWGYFKKIVIADNLAVFVDRIYNNVMEFRGLSLLIATLFFAFQIYCDFSGYSDIAVGIGKLFGVNLVTNFKSPYLSLSIHEFWKRWHITLSSWFLDYVYIPLGGNRKGRLRHAINLMITFLLSGLWHGASGTYILWGGGKWNSASCRI